MLEETRKLYAKALEEVALAYAGRHERIQYDSSRLSYRSVLLRGPQRRCDGFAPEEATRDAYQFTVCSSLFYNALRDMCGFELCDSSKYHICRQIIEQYSEHIVYEYHEGGAVKMNTGISECLAAMEEGDMLIVKVRDRHYHIMGRISGNRIIHSAGGKFNFKTGKDSWEGTGTVRINEIDSYLLNCTRFSFNTFSDWWVVRLLDAIDPEKYPLTPQTLCRMKNPNLFIERIASLRRYQTVQAGDTITYTVRLRNENAKGSKIFHNLQVTEKIPAGTTLVESSLDGEVAVDGDTLKWNVSVRSMQEKLLQYTVRVNDDAVPGTFIVSEGGSVGEIPSNKICTLVSRPRLGLEDCRKLRALAEDGALAEAKITGDGVAQWVYSHVLGKNVNIPTVQAALDTVYDRVAVECVDDEDRETYKNNVLLRRKAELSAEGQQAADMMVPQLLGGLSVDEPDWYERVLEFRGEYLFPGDVVISARNLTRDTLTAGQMVILGGGRAISCTADGVEVIDLPEMDCMFTADYFAVLRPYMAGF